MNHAERILTCALFIVRKAHLDPNEVRSAVNCAVLPASAEVREQFAAASARLLAALPDP